MSLPSALASSSKDVMDEGTVTVKKRRLSYIDAHEDEAVATAEENDGGESCLICLGEIIDQSVLPKCQHSLFCFDCIIKWISIHRRCPLCSTSIEGYIIHSIRSDTDYIRHYLPRLDAQSDKDSTHDDALDPLRLQADLSQTEARRIRRQLQQRVRKDNSGTGRPSGSRRDSNSTRPEWGEDRVEERQRDAIAHWDKRLAFRRRVYQEELYCFHVGSNSTSKLTSPPTHTTIASSPLIESALLSFIRRELLAFPQQIDVDFLSRYTIHVFKSFDFKSDEAIDLMAEFLGRRGSSHFCHECYSYSRFASLSRVRDKVRAFDMWAQYQTAVIPSRPDRKMNATKVVSEVQIEIPEKAKIAEQEASSPLNTRQLVIRGREKLLQKLEEEKRRHMDSSEKGAFPGNNRAAADPAVIREQALKEKLVLQRKEAMLRNRAMEVRAKRLKT